MIGRCLTCGTEFDTADALLDHRTCVTRHPALELARWAGVGALLALALIGVTALGFWGLPLFFVSLVGASLLGAE